MEFIMNLTAWLTALNILLIVSLLIVYMKNVLRARSTFTIGLVLFALLFLVQNVVSLFFSLTMMPLYEQGVENFVLVLTSIHTIAFIILNVITWR